MLLLSPPSLSAISLSLISLSLYTFFFHSSFFFYSVYVYLSIYLCLNSFYLHSFLYLSFFFFFQIFLFFYLSYSTMLNHHIVRPVLHPSQISKLLIYLFIYWAEGTILTPRASIFKRMKMLTNALSVCLV